MCELVSRGTDQLVGRRLTEFVLGEEIQQSERKGAQAQRDQLHVMRCSGGTTRLLMECQSRRGFASDSGELAIVTQTDATALKRSEEKWHELCTHISRLLDIL